jgi:hypothetical protein
MQSAETVLGVPRESHRRAACGESRMRRSGWGPPEKDPHTRAPRRRPTSTLRYNLSYRDVEELLVERGVEVDHVTVYRWVQRCTPLLVDAARFARHAPRTGGRGGVPRTRARHPPRSQRPARSPRHAPPRQWLAARRWRYRGGDGSAARFCSQPGPTGTQTLPPSRADIRRSTAPCRRPAGRRRMAGGLLRTTHPLPPSNGVAT